MSSRPLERLPTIRAKLGSTIIFAVALTFLSPTSLISALRCATRRRTRRLSTPAVGAPDRGRARRPSIPRRHDRDPDAPTARTIDRHSRRMPPAGLHRRHGARGHRRADSYAVVPVRRGPVDRPSSRALARGRVHRPASATRSASCRLLVAVPAGRRTRRDHRSRPRALARPRHDSAAPRHGGGGASRWRRATTAGASTRVSRDEVGQLATAFNRMSAELKTSSSLRRDLRRERLARAQDADHGDPRAPREPARRCRAARSETLQVMLSQSERLGRLVEQLLDLSRLESGERPAHRGAASRSRRSCPGAVRDRGGALRSRRHRRERDADRPPAGRCRPRARAPGAVQPGGQRRAVHSGGRGRYRLGEASQRLGRGAGRRHRRGDPCGAPASSVRAVLPRRTPRARAKTEGPASGSPSRARSSRRTAAISGPRASPEAAACSRSTYRSRPAAKNRREP